MRKRESGGYVLNSKLIQHEKSKGSENFEKIYFQSSLDSRNASHLIVASITLIKIIMHNFTE